MRVVVSPGEGPKYSTGLVQKGETEGTPFRSLGNGVGANRGGGRSIDAPRDGVRGGGGAVVVGKEK